MFSDNVNKYLKIFIMSAMLVLGSIQIYHILTNFSTQWYWLLLATIYTVTINDIFVHRIVSHKMFPINTKSIAYKVLTFLASSDQGYSPVKGMTMSHNLHHIHSDNGPEDVMNWRHHWYSTTIISPIPRKDVKPEDYEAYAERQRKKYKDIFNDPWTKFCARYQNEISLGVFGVLYLIAPVILFNVIFVGRVLLSVMTGLAGFAGHVKNFPGSYRNHNTNDTTSNNMLFHLMFFGLFAGMLQNNHHGRPKAIAPNSRWWELDTSLPIVKFLKFAMEKRT